VSVPSKKRSSTSRSVEQQPKFRYFIDRNLGYFELPNRLRGAGVDILVHDDLYEQRERDPWIFYECGVKHLVLVTSDIKFMRSFPHMVAVELGRTSVVAFANNNKCTAAVRGNAFLKARTEIERKMTEHRGSYFVGVVENSGRFRVAAAAPRPNRKLCDARDWASYERVCQQAGVLALGIPA